MTTRPIKFRAWAINKPNDYEMWNWTHFSRRIAEWMGNEERGVHIMQFTGLKDKNGREIYEGDILMPGLREVMWQEDGAFGHGVGFYTMTHDVDAFSNYVKFSFGKTQAEDCEIIGNVWENPERLKSAA